MLFKKKKLICSKISKNISVVKKEGKRKQKNETLLKKEERIDGKLINPTTIV